MNDVVLISMTKSDLEGLVMGCVTACLKATQKAPETSNRIYITEAEAAEMLGSAKRTIRDHVTAGKLSRHKLGRATRYKREDVLSLMTA